MSKLIQPPQVVECRSWGDKARDPYWVPVFFSNVTTLGTVSESWLYSQECLKMLPIVMLSETHKKFEGCKSLSTKLRSLSKRAFINAAAESEDSEVGSHRGEVIW